MAEQTLTAFGGRLQQAPSAMPQMMVALNFHLTKVKQIIIAGKRDGEDTRAMSQTVHARFIPNKILLLADGGEGQRMLGRGLELIREIAWLEGRATACVGENYTCQLPTTNLTTLARQLEARRCTRGGRKEPGNVKKEIQT